MGPPLRVGFILLLLREAPGWWTVHTEASAKENVPRPSLQEDPLRFAGWAWNSTKDSVTGFQLPDLASHLPDSWDGWIWTVVDMFISTLGWAVFGASWTKVKSGFALIVRVGVVLILCLVAHYLLALCWPMVSLMIGGAMTAVWMVRGATRMLGRVLFYSQRLTGGVPEAVGAEFFGPGLGEVPDTASLRKLKKGSDGDRWVLVRRDGETVIFKVAEASSIKTNGLHLTLEPDTIRGSPSLQRELRGWDKVHICRQDACQEEGQHFKQYAVVKPFDAERFQVTSAASEAHRTGSRLFGWFRTNAVAVAQRAKDYASESEVEIQTCLAHRIAWDEAQGRARLCDQPCKLEGSETTELLAIDRFTEVSTAALCPKHTSEYLRKRFQLKCVVEDCDQVGQLSKEGFRLCSQHVRPDPVPGARSRRSSSSRSRSRSRARDEEGDEPDPGYETEEETGKGLRRRVRLREDGRQGEGDGPDRHGMDTQALLDDIKEERETKVLKRTTASPGNTPRSSVQKNLARMGLVHSPDRRQVQTTLEEFMEQLVDGKELDLTEEDVRRQMAGQYGMTLEALTAVLFEQATEEQRKGTKGLTKFLAKWRKQAAAAKEDSDRSRTDSWSVIEGAKELHHRRLRAFRLLLQNRSLLVRRWFFFLHLGSMERIERQALAG